MTCARSWRATSPTPASTAFPLIAKYATAYNAALQVANMAIACAGYRVTAKTGHHKIAFERSNNPSAIVGVSKRRPLLD